VYSLKHGWMQIENTTNISINKESCKPICTVSEEVKGKLLMTFHIRVLRNIPMRVASISSL
jgi:hypothetical protein